MHQNPTSKTHKASPQRRENIVTAATSIIATEGLAKLSVRTVATQAGCSRGLVEHYFKNKAALLSGANDWANTLYLARVEKAVGAKTGINALEIRLRNLLPFSSITHDEWKVRIAFWHQGITLPSVEETNNRSFFTVYNAIYADMRIAQAEGQIDAAFPLQVASELLLMTVIGLCTSCMNDAKLRRKKPLERRLSMLMTFLKTADVASLEVGDPAVDY